MKKTKRISAILVLSMILSLLPITNMPAQAALGYDFTVSGSKSDYTYVDDTLTITGSGKVTISGTSGHHKIVTAQNVTANVTLQDLHIDLSLIDEACAFDVLGHANITLKGDNILSSGLNRAGLHVGADASVKIDGNGSLVATGKGSSMDSNLDNYTLTKGPAGIGGDGGFHSNTEKNAGGEIEIISGTITAKGGFGFIHGATNHSGAGGGAGIGSGGSGYAGAIR